MARLVSPVKYRGTIGGIRHFKVKGLEGDFAGLAGGPTKEQIRTAPEFQRTRENMSEFSGCAKAGRSVRVALSELLGTMADRSLTGRLTAVMKKINLQDGTEARGERKVQISTQGQFLHSFLFNRTAPFSGAFRGAYGLSHPVDRTSATFTVGNFVPETALSIPSGATHFRMINAIAVVSDFALNPQTGTYEPTQPTLNELSMVTYGDYSSLYEEYIGETITASLQTGTVLTTDTSVLHCIGIEFYQYVGGNYYRLNSGNSLVIDDVF